MPNTILSISRIPLEASPSPRNSQLSISARTQQTRKRGTRTFTSLFWSNLANFLNNASGIHHWFWILFHDFILRPFRWVFGRREMKSTDKALTDINSAFSKVHTGDTDTEDNGSLLEHAGVFISTVVYHKTEIEFYNDTWKSLIAKTDTLLHPITELRRSIERNRINQLPSDLKQALLAFCCDLNHIPMILRRLVDHQNRMTFHFRRYRLRFSREAKMCGHKAMLSFEALSAILSEISRPRIVFNNTLPLPSPHPMLVDISFNATPQRYRFVNCNLIVQQNILRIEEYLDFPNDGYSAISYVWRGKSAKHDEDTGRLAVKGAEHADPISTQVLTHACMTALAQGIPYIWLDRLCIIQTSRYDKNWQIERMFHVYQESRLCVVLAGGTQRLVPLNEETTWIHRGWTLQEVLAPTVVVVLFEWALGTGQGRVTEGVGVTGVVEEVVQRQSATASLSLVLDACSVGYLAFTPKSEEPARSVMVKASIFSDLESHSFRDPPFWQPQRKVLAPNVTALAVAMNLDLITDNDMRNHAIWKSALMRTSSRPVDMVFSIMGLFGVTLDTSAFNRNDRLGATIALAAEILKKGGSATWLGASFQIDPCKQLSTFWTFPRTSVGGKALVKFGPGLRQVSQLVESDYPNTSALLEMPCGIMDAKGYFHFTRKAIPVIPGTQEQQYSMAKSVLPYDHRACPTHFRAKDQSVWQVASSSMDDKDSTKGSWIRTYLVLLGWYSEYYPGATSAHDANDIRAMLVEEHAPDRHHLRTFVFLSRQSKAWVLGWKEFVFAVGGPRGLDTDLSENEDEETREIVVEEERLPFPTSGRPDVTLKDLVTRKSRWAVDQQVLERRLGRDEHD